jgi:hypothetical protein
MLQFVLYQQKAHGGSSSASARLLTFDQRE